MWSRCSQFLIHQSLWHEHSREESHNRVQIPERPVEELQHATGADIVVPEMTGLTLE